MEFIHNYYYYYYFIRNHYLGVIFRRNKILNSFKGFKGDNFVTNPEFNLNVEIYENEFYQIKDVAVHTGAQGIHRYIFAQSCLYCSNYWIHHNVFHNAHNWIGFDCTLGGDCKPGLFTMTILTLILAYVYGNVGFTTMLSPQTGDFDPDKIYKFCDTNGIKDV